MPAFGPTIFGFWWHSSSDCRISTPNNTPNCSTDSTAWHKTINPAESEKSTGIDRAWPASSAHAHQGDGRNWTQDGFGVAFLGRGRLSCGSRQHDPRNLKWRQRRRRPPASINFPSFGKFRFQNSLPVVEKMSPARTRTRA